MRRIYFLFENISQPPSPKTIIPFESFNPHCPCRTSRWGWHVRTGRRKPHSGLAHRASWRRARLCSHYVERLRPAGTHDMSHCLCLWGTCHTKVSTSSCAHVLMCSCPLFYGIVHRTYFPPKQASISCFPIDRGGRGVNSYRVETFKKAGTESPRI